MAGRAGCITENLLGSGDTFSEQSVNNVYVNPIEADAGELPSNPPPSYQWVLEETRLNAKARDSSLPFSSNHRRLRPSRCVNLEPRTSPKVTNLTKRANTISSDGLSNYSTETLTSSAFAEDAEASEADWSTEKMPPVPLRHDEHDELLADYKSGDSIDDGLDASTSYDASSRQLDSEYDDANSLSTLPISQLGDDYEDSNARLGDSSDGLISRQIELPAREYNNDNSKANKKRNKKNAKKDLMAHKSSKLIYAALAKEMGLSCMMTENCRCLDCQGSYLQCTDQNDQQVDTNTDGGLGAGTPMFVSEVFGHAAAPGCNIL